MKNFSKLKAVKDLWMMLRMDDFVDEENDCSKPLAEFPEDLAKTFGRVY